MRFRDVAILGFLLCLIGVIRCNDATPEEELGGQASPNIFIIVIDAASAAYFGCYGDTHNTSPNIDQLAKESVVFDNAYSQAPSTVISTSSLLTGVRPTTHRMNSLSKLSDTFETLPQLLSKHGMQTYGFIGNPFAGAPKLGLDRGYNKCVQVYDLASLNTTQPTAKTNPFRLTSPEDINEQVFTHLRNLGSSGTFSYVHYLQPHKPYDPPKGFLEGLMKSSMTWDDLNQLWKMAERDRRASNTFLRSLEARYRANIRYVDNGIGALLSWLKTEDRYDESLIILMSDHGDAFFKHKWLGHNTTLYDDMVRIPFIIKFPRSDHIAPQRFPHLIETIDVFPTITDYLGIRTSKNLEGESLWSLITSEKKELQSPEIILRAQNSFSSPDWKWAVNLHAIRIGDYKYIHSVGEHGELYNLKKDPDEQLNLIVEEREKAHALREILQSMVDLSAGTTIRKNNELRSDPRMDALLRSLGYTGD